MNAKFDPYELTIAKELQQRANPCDDTTIREYQRAMTRGCEFPPIVAFQEAEGEALLVADGFHRVEAARRADVKIQVEVREGTRRDAILFAIGANTTHGLQRTNADKRKAVMTVLADQEWSRKSDRWIAEMANVSQPFVSGIRKELKENRRQTGKRLGKDGKKRKLPSPRDKKEAIPAKMTRLESKAPEQPTDNVISSIHEVTVKELRGYVDEIEQSLSNLLEDVKNHRPELRRAVVRRLYRHARRTRELASHACSSRGNGTTP